MKTEDYNYELPEELIAQTPLKKRSDSRLLVLDRDTGNITHEQFKNIINYLDENDVLVINDTKVIPARLIGSKEETNAAIELLLLKDLGNDEWECLSRPYKRLHVGTIVNFGDELSSEVIALKGEGIVKVKLHYKGILLEILDRLGSMPLPPYIHERLEQKERYNTVYAKVNGSAAAPTAGLHFTKELLN